MPEKIITEIIQMPRAFLDCLGVGISIVDVETGQIRFANAECCRIFGVTFEQLRTSGTRFIELTHPDDREGNRLQHDKLLAGEIDHYQLDKRYLRADGSTVWARVTVNPIPDAAGALKWYGAVVEDITAMKILENQLAAAEKLAGLSTFNLTLANEHGTQQPITAPSPSLDDMLTQVHADDRDELEKVIRRAVTRRTGYTWDYRVIDDNGATRWVRAMGTCVHSPSEGRTHLVGSTIDITATRLARDGDMPDSIRKILEHIETHWNQKTSIEQLASKYRISPRAVYQYFANNGVSLGDKIKHNRLRHARRMLCNSEAGDTVTSIALRCGFSNAGHFAKEYRKVYGETPSESLRQALSPIDAPADACTADNIR